MQLRRLFHGGVHPAEYKITQGDPIVDMRRDFDHVAIPMHMHTGIPCKPLVSRGDVVALGQVIGEPLGIAVPIHATVSGKVISVKQEFLATGQVDEVITIENDGAYTPDSQYFKPIETTDRQSFLTALRASGLVGLGGAGFPTWQKFPSIPDQPLEILLVNGMECEPYITSDHRQMLEQTELIIAGVVRVVRELDFKQAIIGVEDNKPDALEALRLSLQMYLQDADERSALAAAKVEVRSFPTRFPQGAAKVFVKAATGREVPAFGRTTAVGVQVINVTTCLKLEAYFSQGEPLIDKVITLTGDAVAGAGNYRVPIGAKVSDLIEKTGGYLTDPAKLLMGGPMNGIALSSDDVSIVKQNNAILALSDKLAKNHEELPCIRCGKCVKACPMRLMPLMLDRAAREQNFEELDTCGVMNCIECGACSFVCPSKRYLVQSIKVGKSFYRIESNRLKTQQRTSTGVTRGGRA